MQVKQLLCDIMRMVGRPDAAEECESEQLTAATSRMRNALLLCLNAVVDELARGYFPLKAEESFSVSQGKVAFSSFAHTPYRIISVRSEDGRKIKWSYRPSFLCCEADRIVVQYEYVPARLALEDDFVYPDSAVGPALAGYGAAAEYMLIEGDVERAGAWEQKYRAEIDRQLSLSPVRGRISPRRWL